MGNLQGEGSQNFQTPKTNKLFHFHTKNRELLLSFSVKTFFSLIKCYEEAMCGLHTPFQGPDVCPTIKLFLHFPVNCHIC